MLSSHQTILIVDDDPDDVFFVRRFFERSNSKVHLEVLSDGADAIAYLAGEAPYNDRSLHPLPSVILMDLKMPRQNGFDVLEWLKSQPDLKVIPTVIISSSQLPQDIKRAYELGANSYLTKPVNYGDLFDMLKVFNSYWMEHVERPAVSV